MAKDTKRAPDVAQGKAVGSDDYRTRVAHPQAQQAEQAGQAGRTVLQVRAGRVLLWPDGTMRGKGGTLVWSDDPFTKGREAVLQPAPAGAGTPKPIDHPAYALQQRRMQRGNQPQPPRAPDPTARRDARRAARGKGEQAANVAEATGEINDADLPDADED